MSCFSIQNVKIVGMAAAVPKQEVSNLDYDHISEKDRKLLIKTTGIEKRRIAPAHLTASDLCETAAKPLLEALNWAPETVDALIFVTQTPDQLMPATAMQLQNRLGLSKSCLSFDLHQGCAGYVYGLATIAGFLAGGHLKRALLLVGDTITHTLNPKDKSTAPIFADAGSATALEFSQYAPEMHFNLQSDGAGYQAIQIEAGGSRKPMSLEMLEEKEVAPGICRSPGQMSMSGLDVFNFALREVVPNLKSLLDFAKIDSEAPDYYIFHQANLLLNETLRKKMGLPREKVPYTLQKFGNTSCATIPVTLVAELRETLKKEPLQFAASGFGVGLSWGSALFKTSEITCLPLLEVE